MGVGNDGSWLWWWVPLCFTFISMVAAVLFYVFRVKRRRDAASVDPAASPQDDANDFGNSSHSSDLAAQPGYEYEVFLSFRGPDTRKGFTDYLYTALKDAGIRAFRDNEELRKGEEIGPELLAAIKQSKVAVPIFSKDYASSKWCLKELAQIWECQNTMGQVILPIFYYVTPNEVRHQTGGYGKSFSRHWHSRRYDADTVQQWRDALAKAGALKGWDVENATNGHEGQLVKLVVTEILKILKKRHLSLTDTLVGIDDQAKEVMQLLEVSAKDMRMVGLWGMGGIGKTTLAKYIYNEILDQFEGCSFLKDVRETSRSQSRGLEYLQSQLVADITRREGTDFRTTDDGINSLEQRFRDKKVLILLDDVDHRDQLNALAKELHWFGPGSRIIITSRNKDVLQVDQKWIYEVKEMDPDQALQLFCKHALRDGSPVAELSGLAKDIAATTGGLPLALEVIGSYLSSKGKVVWESTLQKLKAMPDAEVQNKLRISYDALDDGQKQIFLDIACMFVGEDVHIVSYMWKDCGFFPENGIDVLQMMSLIKIVDDNELWMHDQLIDFGREIVRQEDCKQPGNRSRMWNSEEATNVLENGKGSTHVEAICVGVTTESEDKIFLTDQQFRNLSNLRYLLLRRVDLRGDFRNLLPELRWVTWRNSLFHATMPSLNLKNLVILDLSWTEVGDDWIHRSLVKMAKLKVLYLNYCNHLTTSPNFSGLTNLERLSMANCNRLKIIDPSIQKLESLIYLDISICVCIEKLPDEIGSLKSLEVLNAKFCTSLTLIPDSIGQATSLLELLLDHSNIIKLPHSIGSLGRLRHLSLQACKLLKEIPDSIGQLKSLIKLDLHHTAVTHLPDSFGKLKNLEELDISQCRFLRFPRALGNLRMLKVINASWCSAMEGELPSELGQMSLLTVLRLDNTKITSLPESIGSLSHLETLDLEDCSELYDLPALPASLRIVHVSSMSQAPIPNLPSLINLKKLTFSCCYELSTLPAEISELSKLEKLKFYRTPVAHILDRIAALSGLKSLTISTTFLDSLPTLPSLHELKIFDCNSFQIFPDESNLQNLSKLHIMFCRKLKEIPYLGNLVFLAHLEVSYCRGLTNIDGIKGLEGLKFLKVSYCENIEKLPDLSKLKNLLELRVNWCKNFCIIEDLDDLCCLNRLEISYCTSLETLPDLSSLKLLEMLIVTGCEKLQELEGLGHLEALRYLDIADCKQIKRLPNLSKLKSLSYIKIKGCENLTEIPGLEREEGHQKRRLFETEFCLLRMDIKNKDRMLASVACNLRQLQQSPDLGTLSRKIENELGGVPAIDPTNCSFLLTCHPNTVALLAGLSGDGFLQFFFERLASRIQDCSRLCFADGRRESWPCQLKDMKIIQIVPGSNCEVPIGEHCDSATI